VKNVSFSCKAIQIIYLWFFNGCLSDSLGKKVTSKCYLNFPSVLRGALLEGKVAFGDHVLCKYEPIQAYRVIKRKDGDTTPIQLSDFKSQMEQLKDEGRERSRHSQVNENHISCYSCSFFNTLSALKKNFCIPNAYNSKIKIIIGYVKDDYGPCEINEKKHINLWLYAGCDPSSEFKVLS
jgi:hypothetical protein